MMSNPYLRALICLAGVAVAAFAVPALSGGSPYVHYMIQTIMVYLLATTGLNIAIGFAGQFQMAQGAVMATSAYAVAILTGDYGFGFLPAAAFALLIALALGAFVALFSSRLASHYLLLATFGIQVIAVGVIRELGALTGGVNGRSALISLDLAGFSFVGSTPAYSSLMIVIAGIGLVVCDWLKRSYIGLGMQAARQNDRMAFASGVYANRFKFGAVLASTAYAAVAGLFVGPIHTYLVPDSFGIEITLILLVMVVVGGAGSIVGVAAATIVLAVASQVAQSATTAWPLIYGLFVMAILTVTSRGALGLKGLGARLLARRPAPAPDAASAAESEPVHLAPVAVVRPERAAPVPAEKELVLDDLRKSFGGVTALDGVTFDVGKGTVHGLVGPNGSGKTTLFEVVSGFVRQDHGSITAFGHDVSTLGVADRACRGIGRSFQHPTVLADCTVLENALLGAMKEIAPGALLTVVASDPDDGDRKARALDALALVGLVDWRDEKAGRLSYGQRKLLDIARVVASRPRLVLLDEPVAGVDATSAAYVRAAIERMKQEGRTTILVEHNMRFVMGLSDQVTVLGSGKLIASGTPAEVAHDPAVIRSYLGTGGAAARDAGTVGNGGAGLSASAKTVREA